MRDDPLFHRFLTFASLFALALFSTAVTLAGDTPALRAKVSGVARGDTITLFDDKKAYTVHLYGVRCPRKDRPWGREAREFVTDMVFGKTVEVRMVAEVQGDRSSAVIAVQGQSVNEELVKRGLAWVNTLVCKEPICSRWTELESQAKAEKKGLWGEPGTAHPWKEKRREKPRSRPPN